MSDTEDAKKRWPTLRYGLVSALLLWCAQPPLGIWPLAWLAPLGWIHIAHRSETLDRGDWLLVWLSGFVYWFAVLHWIRLPHPLTIFGWPLLAIYLGCYPLMFVWLTRRGSKNCRIPFWIAAAVAWTGLEFLQAHLFTGFLMGALSHSQVDQLWLIQIANMLGAYGVSFLLVAVAACFYEMILGTPCRNHRIGMPLTAIGLVLISVIYSKNSLEGVDPASENNQLTIALIQGNELATWDADPNRSQRIMDTHTKLSVSAIQKAQAEQIAVDLVIWPESMFRTPVYTFGGDLNPPINIDENLLESHKNTAQWFQLLTAKLSSPLLAGVDHFDWTNASGDPELLKMQVFNSAVLVDATGKVSAIYDKNHRVPFGEYIPFASNMPALYYLTPMAGGLKAGDGPTAMTIKTKQGGKVTLAATICYESVVPHVVRSHVSELDADKQTPDLIVNVTNDAWFWGSSELDMHLACNVFRAVENGRPMVIAANGGLSAAISATGEKLAVSNRQQEEFVLAKVRLSNQPISWYAKNGDWFAMSCFLVTAYVALASVFWGVKAKTKDGSLSQE